MNGLFERHKLVEKLLGDSILIKAYRGYPYSRRGNIGIGEQGMDIGRGEQIDVF